MGISILAASNVCTGGMDIKSSSIGYLLTFCCLVYTYIHHNDDIPRNKYHSDQRNQVPGVKTPPLAYLIPGKRVMVSYAALLFISSIEEEDSQPWLNDSHLPPQSLYQARIYRHWLCYTLYSHAPSSSPCHR